MPSSATAEMMDTIRCIWMSRRQATINSAAVIAGRMAGAITQSVVKPAVIVCPP